MSNVLTMTTFIPLIAAAILAIFLRGEDEFAQRAAKWVALVATVLTFLVSIAILAQFVGSGQTLYVRTSPGRAAHARRVARSAGSPPSAPPVALAHTLAHAFGDLRRFRFTEQQEVGRTEYRCQGRDDRVFKRRFTFSQLSE